MSSRFILPYQTVIDGNGAPLAGAKLYFYQSGTSTPLDTYSDAALTTPNANPVVANANGQFPAIFLKDQDYKAVLHTASDVMVWTADPVSSGSGGMATVASAATVDLGAVTAEVVTITGAVTITSFGTAREGVERRLIFAGALTLTHNATSLILPTGASIATAAGDVASVVSLGGGNWRCTGYQRANGKALAETPAPSAVPPAGHIYGLGISLNATTPTTHLDIAAGECASSDTTPIMIRLASVMTKRLDATWAAGSGNGGLDTGARAASTAYHVWLIAKADGTTDVLLSTSATAPTMPAGYIYKRWLGSRQTDASGNWRTDGAGHSVGLGYVEYCSGELAITSAGILTLAHGLGVKPSRVDVSAVCKVAEYGYTVGDEADVATGRQYANGGLQVRRQSSSILVKYGSSSTPIYLVDASTGAERNVTNASWRIILRART